MYILIYISGFNLTICDSYFMVLIEVFMNHISAENTYFMNHIVWTEHKIKVLKINCKDDTINHSNIYLLFDLL